MVHFEVLDDVKYRQILDELKKEVLENFGERDQKKFIVIDYVSHRIELSKLVFNMIIFQFHHKRGLKFTFDDFYLEDYIVSGVLKKHFDKMIETYKDNDIPIDQTREDIRDVLDELTRLAADISGKNGQTISFLDFINTVKDPKIKDTFYQTIEFGKSYNEIEKQFSGLGEEFLEYYKSNPNSEIHAMAVSDCGMNLQQFTQLCGFVGTKPDIQGNIIPYVVSNNYLRGLKEKEDVFISAKGCRKATLLGKTNVRKSGYLTQKISLLMMDRYNDDLLEDCGTQYYVKFKVDNFKILKRIIGRHYYLIDQENTDLITSELKTITGNEKELIGIVIGLRSPVTCCSEFVCQTCYGKHLAKVNRGRNTGLLANYFLTNPLSQKMLSAKHLLKTDSDQIDWKELGEIFVQNMENLYLFTDDEFEIQFEDMTEDDNYDNDEDLYFVRKMKIVKDKKTIEYISPEPLYINPKIFDRYFDEKTNGLILSKKNIGEFEDWIFMYFVKNNELMKSLQDVIDLIDKTDHLGVTNYHDFVNKFVELVIENGIRIQSVHLEMITSALIFEKDTYDRMDFNKENITEENYDIERVTTAVMKGPASVSISFERLNEQIANPLTYYKKNKSLFDRLFL